VAKGFPWDVLAGAPEYEGLGYSRLTTEVTKGRLRLFQNMAVSRFATENDLARKAQGGGADYDEHERCNVEVDALTHAITPDMPLYISFRRSGRRQTQLWYEPTEHENVGHGICHEVTGDVYRHITKSAQRRASIGRIVKHCGEFHATFERGVTGRSPAERPGPTVSKILNNHLSTESRVSL